MLILLRSGVSFLVRLPTAAISPVRSGSAARSLSLCQQLLEITQPVKGEPGFAGFAPCHLGLQERLDVGKRAIELLRDAHHRAGLLDTFDRFFQDVDLHHSHQTHSACFVPMVTSKAAGFAKIIWMMTSMAAG